jgi:hypothetical protein
MRVVVEILLIRLIKSSKELLRVEAGWRVVELIRMAV